METGVAAVSSTERAVPRSAQTSGRETTVRRFMLRTRAACALLRAWRARAGRRMDAIRFPLAHPSTRASRREVADTLRCARTLVRYGAWSDRKCFLRTFIVVSVLRRHGLDARMNVGLVGCATGEETSGHCWTTVDGVPIGETTDPTSDYPHAMGTAPNGIHYWLGHTTERTAR